GLLVDVERLARPLDDARVRILLQLEQLAEVVNRLADREPRAHLLNLDADGMSLRLREKLPREVDEQIEVAAGTKMRIDIGLDGVDADAQPLERRREELRPHGLGQHQPVRRYARLGEEADRVIDARVEERLPHLVHPLEL